MPAKASSATCRAIARRRHHLGRRFYLLSQVERCTAGGSGRPGRLARACTRSPPRRATGVPRRGARRAGVVVLAATAAGTGCGRSRRRPCRRPLPALLTLATPSYPWYTLLALAFVPFAGRRACSCRPRWPAAPGSSTSSGGGLPGAPRRPLALGLRRRWRSRSAAGSAAPSAPARAWRRRRRAPDGPVIPGVAARPRTSRPASSTASPGSTPCAGTGSSATTARGSPGALAGRDARIRQRMLELGCGPGYYARHSPRAMPDCASPASTARRNSCARAVAGEAPGVANCRFVGTMRWPAPAREFRRRDCGLSPLHDPPRAGTRGARRCTASSVPAGAASSPSRARRLDGDPAARALVAGQPGPARLARRRPVYREPAAPPC